MPTDALPVTKLVFVGTIVPARCVQAAIEERGDYDFIYDGVRKALKDGDLTIGVLNATLSDFPPHDQCGQSTLLLVGMPESANAMARAGIDGVSVATNHIKNCGISTCGDRAFFDTLDNLQAAGVAPIGAGMNHAEAMQPVVMEVNGIRFGFVSLGELEPNVFADEQTPGIAVLTEDNLRQGIAAAREVSDVVIALPHWGPEYSPMPNPSQLNYAGIAVEAGADLVVGNHSHVLQAMEVIDEVPVFYSLGSFVFDQTQTIERQQGLLVEVYFAGDQLSHYEVIPVRIDGFTGAVSIADEEEGEQILQRFEEVSENIPPVRESDD